MLTNIKTESLDRNRDENLLCPVNPNEFLPQIDWWVTTGGLVLLGIFGAAIALTSILRYKVTVKAPATIRPVGELRIVQAAMEGKIESIAVKENQEVVKGDILAYVDDSRLQTQKIQLQGNIEQTQLELAQIAIQIEATTRQINAEDNRLQGNIAAATAELSRSHREYQDRSSTANAEVEEAIANSNSTEAQLNQAQTELIALQADLRSAWASLKRAKSKRDRYNIIADSGALSQDQLEEAKLDVEQQQQQVVAKQAAIQQQHAKISQQQQILIAAKARLNNSQVALNPSRAGIEIAQQQILQAKAQAKATLATLNKEREQLVQQQIKIQNQLRSDLQELQQIETELKRTAIRAAASGIVQKLNLRNPDQIVSTGDIIAQIAPSDAPLEIRALVASQDIEKVETGGKVQMRVSGCPYPDYGTLGGTVTAISPDANASPETQANSSHPPNFKQAQSTYGVAIKPNSLSLQASSKECAVRSGMEGKVDIIAKEETVLRFILRKARLLVDV